MKRFLFIAFCLFFYSNSAWAGPCDTTISGAYPSGYPLEYNSHNPGATPLINHITDLNNWDLDNISNTAEILRTGNSINNIYST